MMNRETTIRHYNLVILLLVIAFSLTSSACCRYFLLDEGCGSNQLEEVRSPDGKWKAVKFYSWCNGQYRGAYISVYVISGNEQFKEGSPGEVFKFNDAVCGSSSPRGSSSRAKEEIKIRWLDEHNLIISYNKKDTSVECGTRVRKAEESFGDIKISYE